MAAFFRRRKKQPGSEAQEIPSDLWEACPGCHQLLYSKELEQELRVCAKCGHHFRLSVWQRLEITADPDSFQAWDEDLPLVDPLEFTDYLPKTRAAREKTGMSEAILTGSAQVLQMPVGLGIMDLGFVGGSMGWVVGEMVTRMMERCLENRWPAIIFCASGGARMQESLVALMQMPKTSGAIGRLSAAGLPYVSVLTDPTYGGVTASYAFLGDYIFAEPGAAMGFAGPRVIEVTNIKMAEGVQTAEFQYAHGMIDALLPRKQIRETLGLILRWSMAQHGVETPVRPKGPID